MRLGAWSRSSNACGKWRGEGNTIHSPPERSFIVNFDHQKAANMVNLIRTRELKHSRIYDTYKDTHSQIWLILQLVQIALLPSSSRGGSSEYKSKLQPEPEPQRRKARTRTQRTHGPHQLLQRQLQPSLSNDDTSVSLVGSHRVGGSLLWEDSSRIS